MSVWQEDPDRLSKIVRFEWEGKHYEAGNRAKLQGVPVRLPDGKFVSLGSVFKRSIPPVACHPARLFPQDPSPPFDCESARETDASGIPLP